MWHLGPRDMTTFSERASKKDQNLRKIPITFATVAQIQ